LRKIVQIGSISSGGGSKALIYLGANLRAQRSNTNKPRVKKNKQSTQTE
jgi:hypothetical protein